MTIVGGLRAKYCNKQHTPAQQHKARAQRRHLEDDGAVIWLVNYGGPSAKCEIPGAGQLRKSLIWHAERLVRRELLLLDKKSHFLYGAGSKFAGALAIYGSLCGCPHIFRWLHTHHAQIGQIPLWRRSMFTQITQLNANFAMNPLMLLLSAKQNPLIYIQY